jgi:hypothetical protein
MKSIITTGFLAASLAFTGNAAMAAAAQPHKAAAAAHVTRPQAVQHAPVYGAWSNGTWPAGAWPDIRAAQTPVFGAARPAVQIVARSYLPGGPLGADIGQFIQGMLSGGPVPYANLIRDAQRMRGSPGSYDFSSPTYDDSPAVAASAASEAQAASDAENQAIQQMNDTNAMTASMAAAEEQNDEANAATLQTEINAGM